MFGQASYAKLRAACYFNGRHCSTVLLPMPSTLSVRQPLACLKDAYQALTSVPATADTRTLARAFLWVSEAPDKQTRVGEV
jgi:hypothetical protein